MGKEAKILTAILVAAVGAMVGLFILTGSGEGTAERTPVDAGKLVRDNSNKTGTGAVTVVEFGDFQCPSCAIAQPTVQRIKQEYGDKITFVFRNFPLPMHQNAEVAAKAAEAAGAQGKYWEMNDKLFASLQEWSDLPDPKDTFTQYATELGVSDIDRFKRELSDDTYTQRISDDKADGEAVGVQGTPTFFVNGQLAQNFQYETLKELIDQQLSQQ